jgi:nucleoid DNA-binding protein
MRGTITDKFHLREERHDSEKEGGKEERNSSPEGSRSENPNDQNGHAGIESHVKKGAAGQFTFPGLLKIEVRHKPATKAHKGVNPFTGEETMFKAKPARNVVKIRPLKRLKDMVA